MATIEQLTPTKIKRRTKVNSVEFDTAGGRWPPVILILTPSLSIKIYCCLNSLFLGQSGRRMPVVKFFDSRGTRRIAATLTHVNVKVHVVAGDGCHRRSGVSLVAGFLRCVKFYWL